MFLGLIFLVHAKEFLIQHIYVFKLHDELVQGHESLPRSLQALESYLLAPLNEPFYDAILKAKDGSLDLWVVVAPAADEVPPLRMRDFRGLPYCFDDVGCELKSATTCSRDILVKNSDRFVSGKTIADERNRNDRVGVVWASHFAVLAGRV